ncbi:uncharacterized protein RAG0_00641 [Rhynchosporium agropyri]|uniref:Uncharacterized protein n=1 Tax=Rhynchosporium agropyri TaxID=914238 RepID=A0A1E1JTN4_9HELO|nr:uncharacterized protein RAG0_00641 [Rhynchosporium agropyri]
MTHKSTSQSMSKAASPICVNYFLMTLPCSMSYLAILGLNLSTWSLLRFMSPMVQDEGTRGLLRIALYLGLRKQVDIEVRREVGAEGSEVERAWDRKTVQS